MPWFSLEAADPSFFETAPIVHRFPLTLPVPPGEVWDSLASDRSLADWGRAVHDVRWTTPRPFGVGTTRDVVLPLGAAVAREEFFRWDEGRGYSFFVRESNRPGLRRLAEDYRLEPAGAGTSFTWVVALEFAGPAARLSPVLGPASRLAFAKVARDCARYFASRRA